MGLPAAAPPGAHRGGDPHRARRPHRLRDHRRAADPRDQPAAGHLRPARRHRPEPAGAVAHPHVLRVEGRGVVPQPGGARRRPRPRRLLVLRPPGPALRRHRRATWPSTPSGSTPASSTTSRSPATRAASTAAGSPPRWPAPSRAATAPGAGDRGSVLGAIRVAHERDLAPEPGSARPCTVLAQIRVCWRARFGPRTVGSGGAGGPGDEVLDVLGGGGDHQEAVAGAELGGAGGDHDLVGPEDGGDAGPVGQRRVGERAPDHR